MNFLICPYSQTVDLSPDIYFQLFADILNICTKRFDSEKYLLSNLSAKLTTLTDRFYTYLSNICILMFIFFYALFYIYCFNHIALLFILFVLFCFSFCLRTRLNYLKASASTQYFLQPYFFQIFSCPLLDLRKIISGLVYPIVSATTYFCGKIIHQLCSPTGTQVNLQVAARNLKQKKG